MTRLSPEFIATWTPRVLDVLRIVTAYLFLQHGTAKVFHFPHQAMFDNLQLMSFFGMVGVFEVIAGALALLGLCTRPVTFLLSGFSAFAYFIGHAGKGYFLLPMLNGGELAVLYCFIFLALSVTGAGPWSLDALMRKRTA